MNVVVLGFRAAIRIIQGGNSWCLQVEVAIFSAPLKIEVELEINC